MPLAGALLSGARGGTMFRDGEHYRYEGDSFANDVVLQTFLPAILKSFEIRDNGIAVTLDESAADVCRTAISTSGSRTVCVMSGDNVELNLHEGNDRLTVNRSIFVGQFQMPVLVSGGPGLDTLDGGVRADEIDGGEEPDAISGGPGDDLLKAGDDEGGFFSRDELAGDAGDDTLQAAI